MLNRLYGEVYSFYKEVLMMVIVRDSCRQNRM